MGSLILAVEALVIQQWGFLLLEAVWAAVTVASIIAVWRKGAVTAADDDAERRG